MYYIIIETLGTYAKMTYQPKVLSKFHPSYIWYTCTMYMYLKRAKRHLPDNCLINNENNLLGSKPLLLTNKSLKFVFAWVYTMGKSIDLKLTADWDLVICIWFDLLIFGCFWNVVSSVAKRTVVRAITWFQTKSSVDHAHWQKSVRGQQYCNFIIIMLANQTAWIWNY